MLKIHRHVGLRPIHPYVQYVIMCSPQSIKRRLQTIVKTRNNDATDEILIAIWICNVSVGFYDPPSTFMRLINRPTVYWFRYRIDYLTAGDVVVWNVATARWFTWVPCWPQSLVFGTASCRRCDMNDTRPYTQSFSVLRSWAVQQLSLIHI